VVLDDAHAVSDPAREEVVVNLVYASSRSAWAPTRLPFPGTRLIATVHVVELFSKRPSICDYHFAQVLPHHALRESTMPSPLTPSSSQEIIPISPPPYASSSKSKSKPIASTSTSTSASISTTLPQPAVFTPDSDLHHKIRTHQQEYDAKAEVQGGKRKARRGAVEEERDRAGKMSRNQMTERMVGHPIHA
jgi:hypothetical protein